MSVRRWNTSFEREQLKMLTHTIALYESSHVAMFSLQEMEGVDEEDDNNLMSDSSSSSSSSTSSSSSSSSSTSSLSSVGNMDAMEEEDDLLNLVISTQQLNRKINSPFTDPNVQWGKSIQVDDLSESECIENCRMRKDCLIILLEKLWPSMNHHLDGIREQITCVNRYTIPYETGMIILLYRYSRPRRLRPDMELIFGIRKSRISAIIQTFSEALYNVAINYMVNPQIWHQTMPYYSQLISDKTGGVATDIWGFIDGTIRKTARPIYHQRTVYTRFKKCHGLKFQSILVPDGFIACLFGPVPAKTHDSRLLRESGVLQQLQQIMPPTPATTIYSLYGDLAYPQSVYLLGGFRNVQVGTDEALFNRLLSSVRITVEWGFGELVDQWKFLDFRQAMKIFKCPVAQYYVNAAFLSNLRNCLLGSKTQQYFGATQLTIDEYLLLYVHE